MTPTGPLRRLSGTEAACAWRHALTGGQTQTTTRLTVAAELSPAHVEQAVARWVREFRALSLRIVEEGGSLWFHEVPGLAADQLRQETYTSTASGRSQSHGSGSGSGSGSGPDHDYDRVHGDGHGHSGAAEAEAAPRTEDVLRAGGPLWRLEVGHDPAAAATHLLLTCHPALADGPSTGRLLRALLNALLGPGPGGRGRGGKRQDPAPPTAELGSPPPHH
ncbi:hypothetical protein ACFV06_31860, partial [Streptomyces sp. NPDC059618]